MSFKSLPKNIISLGSADVIGRLIGFFAITYLARTLGPANMGILAVGMAILTYATIFSEAGLPILGTRFVASNTDSIPYLVKRICSARLLLSLFAIIIGALILILSVNDNSTRDVAIIYLLTLFPAALLLEWLFQGLHRMATLAAARIIGMSVYLLSLIITISTSGNLYWVPISWCIGFIAQAIYLWRVYKKDIDDEKYEAKPLKPFGIIKQGIPLGVATLISQIVIQFPFIYLGFFDTAENTGLYSIAFRVVILMLVIDRVFYTIFFPAISRSFKQAPGKLENHVDRTLKFVTTISIYVAIIALTTGRSVFPLLFGPEFHNSSIIFQTLMGYFILTVINSVFTFTLIGMEMERFYTRSLAIGAIVFFSIILLPIRLNSVLLLPIALALFQIITLVEMIRYLRRVIKINLLRRVIAPLLMMILIAFITGQLYHISSVLIPIITLIAALPIIGISAGINREDLHYLKRLIA